MRTKSPPKRKEIERPAPEAGIPFMVSLLLGAAISLPAAGFYAYYAMFSQFQPHDDEGHLMAAVRAFNAGFPLYDRAGTYGPFYHLYEYVLHAALGLPIDHDTTRLISIAMWLATALVLAALTYRLSRSTVSAALIGAAAVLHLRAVANEPGHPQEACILLVSAALLVAAGGGATGPGRNRLVALGALLASLLLTKVNIGIYALAAAGLVLLAYGRQARAFYYAWLLATGLAIALPAAVMWRHLGAAWAQAYCGAVTLGLAAATPVIASTAPKAETSWRHVASLAVGFAAASFAAVTFAWLHGNSLYGIIDSTFLLGFRFSGVYADPVAIDRRALAAGIAAVASATAWSLRSRGFPNLAAAAKLGFGLTVIYWVAYGNPYRSNALLAYAIPFLWLVMIPTPMAGGREGTIPLARALLCLTAILQGLVAYPVHGSQAYWATFLVLPAAGVCLGDAARQISAASRVRAGRRLGREWARSGLSLGVMALIWLAFAARVDLPGFKRMYDQRAPLALPGAERIRLNAKDAGVYHWLVNNLRAYCDGFWGLPGYPSLHFWTGIEPPTFYGGAWVLFMDEKEQQAAVDAIARYDRFCVVYREVGLKGWLRGNPLPQRALVRRLTSDYREVLKRGGYALWVERNRAGERFPDYLLFGARDFDGTRDSSIPVAPAVLAEKPALTIRGWFCTRRSGVIAGYERTPGSGATFDGAPLLYVGDDGLLRAELWNGSARPIVSRTPLNDGAWHHFALAADGSGQRLYVDGEPAGELPGRPAHGQLVYAQLGGGAARGWPGVTGAWLGFAGKLAEVIVDSDKLGGEAVAGHARETLPYLDCAAPTDPM